MFNDIIMFTDIHFGLKGNSKAHNKDCLGFIYFVIEEAKKRNCKKGIFLGDWHHNRQTINVETLYYSNIGLKLINDYFDEFYMLVGNHDMYHKDVRDITSVSFSESFPNIKLIDELTYIDDIALLPWLVGDEWKSVKKKKSKYVFGHFELPTFLLNQMVEMPETNELSKNDLSFATYVFSGHFHKRQNKDNVWYIGNCFPHDFADINDDERGITYLKADEAPEFIQWDNAPRYRKYSYKDIHNHESDYLSEPKIHLKLEYNSSEIPPLEISSYRELIKDKYNLRSIKLIDVATTEIKADVDDETKDTMVNIDSSDIDTVVVKHLELIESEEYDVSELIRIYKEL